MKSPLLQRLFLRAHGTPLALPFRAAYAAAVRFVSGRLIGTPGVRAVYLTSGLLDEPIYGLSDIDLVVLVDDPDGYAVLRVVELAAYLKTIVPMLEPPEAIGVYSLADLPGRLATSPRLQYRLLGMPHRLLFGRDLLADFRPTALPAAQALAELSDTWALAVRVLAQEPTPERPYQWRKILARAARALHFARTGTLVAGREQALATLGDDPALRLEDVRLADAWRALHRLISAALPALAPRPPAGPLRPLPIAGDGPPQTFVAEDPLVLPCEHPRTVVRLDEPPAHPDELRGALVEIGDVLYPLAGPYGLALRPLHPEAFSAGPVPEERLAEIEAALARRRDALRPRVAGRDPYKLADDAWARFAFNLLETTPPRLLTDPAAAALAFTDEADRATVLALAAWLADPRRGELPRPLFHASLALCRRTLDLATTSPAASPLRVSVVVCTRNRAAPLDRFLGRVAAQRRPADEVVVVDNGSSDDTRQVAERWQPRLPVRYVFHAPPGVPGARNAGAAAATGDVIAYADDDTEPEPDWLAALEAPFLRDPHIGVVGGEVLQARAQRGPIADFFRRYMGEAT